ncbi:MAG: LPS export ABC transporter periplasmic protein LptC [Zoogloea sp.]|nr:LPS export ABC transporter periplasmic protein LptC [Zoogloea sp.]
MNSRGHSLFPIIVLLLLAGVSVWLDRVTQQEETVKTDKTRHEPDFTADKLTLRRFDLSGKTQYILVADRMIHYGDDESSELIRPRLTTPTGPEPVRGV